MKTLAMAAMMLMGTATTYAKSNPTMKNDNHKPAPVVVVNNNRPGMKADDHSRYTKPMNHCTCKHCKKLNAKIEAENRRHAEKMHKLEACRNHSHEVKNLRAGK